MQSAVSRFIFDLREQEWRNHAACIGLPTDVFFPRSMAHNKWDEGKKVCDGCSVRKECLALALKIDETEDRWGIYGGLTPAERLLVRDRKNPIYFRK